MEPVMVVAEARSALNARSVGRTIALPIDGVVEAVTPVFPDGESVPHGRLFAICELVDRGGEVMARLWRGYLSSGATATGGVTCNEASSTPHVRAMAGWGLRVTTWQASGGAAMTVHFHAHLAEAASTAPGYIHDEAPGSGIGEQRAVSLGDPAAGASYADQVVPAVCAWQVRGYQGALVTDANAANRAARIIFTDGADNILTGSTLSQIAAGVTHGGYLFGVGVPNAGIAQNGGTLSSGIPVVVLGAGYKVKFVIGNIQAGDNLGAGYMMVEEWAVP